ncbi:GNAT family N-acetyltransferase [Nostoc sp. FACHB-133]|uniref:GNAT family N-acetyltransferase n=1 Tax=Nostoc sp. FACHB-133 TaxID=2692835 RepID=UPI0028C4E224|nr:GNAT family N-acetyltransferase [Nostoc sp. FACHB-133]
MVGVYVESACTTADMKVWIAIDSDSTVSFVAVKLHSESSMGEIYMIAVDPDYQRQGIGAALVVCTYVIFTPSKSACLPGFVLELNIL